MPLLDVTREFVVLVEKDPGYPVKLVADPDLPTLAKVRMAHDNVPAHFARPPTTNLLAMKVSTI